jgi:hypothetical protein
MIAGLPLRVHHKKTGQQPWRGALRPSADGDVSANATQHGLY